MCPSSSLRGCNEVPSGQGFLPRGPGVTETLRMSRRSRVKHLTTLSRKQDRLVRMPALEVSLYNRIVDYN